MIQQLQGDCRDVLPTLAADSVHTIVTSPPYWNLRDYGTALWDGGDVLCDHLGPPMRTNNKPVDNAATFHGGTTRASEFYRDTCGKCGARRVDRQIGLESSPEDYLATMVAVFRELKRVLRPDGVVFCNLGDSYRDKQLQMMPARLALALQADGWILRSDIIWHKPNPMPESVQGSQVIRHMVTIADYERLQGLRRAEGEHQDRTSDLSCVSAGEVSYRQAPLSADRQGQSNGQGQRGTAGRDGEAQGLLGITPWPGEQGEIRDDPEGQGDPPEAVEALSLDRVWQAESGREASGDEGSAASGRADKARQRQICQVAEDGGEEASGLCAAEVGDRGRQAIHGGDVGSVGQSPRRPVLLLQEATQADDRPCDPGEQGRPARGGERRASVSELQCEEEQPADASRLVDCPGCSKCHNGYITRLSAGRPTSAHEHVFLLTRSARYFYDADAVREPHDARVRAVESYGNIGVNGGHQARGYTDAAVRNAIRLAPGARVYHPAGRSCRNVWTIATEAFPDAHFATYPTELVSRCIRAGSRKGDTILDPFSGSGTTLLVADRLQRNAIGIDLNPTYNEMAEQRITADCPLFTSWPPAEPPEDARMADLFAEPAQ